MRSFTSDGRIGFGSKNLAVVVLAWKSISTDSILVFGIFFHPKCLVMEFRGIAFLLNLRGVGGGREN